MTALDPIDLHDAELAVAVANTPIFLARRLQENPAVQRAHVLHGADKIFGALEAVSARKPRDLSEATEVYFYIVALSFDDQKSWLRRARTLPAPHIKWFSDIADYLIDTSNSTVVTTVQAPTRIIVGQQSAHDAAANTRTVIRL
jgi:hypothetical protein